MGKTFRDAMNEQLESFRATHRDREITVWELFLSLVDAKGDLYILALKADMPILERIARGMSPSSIAGQMGIKTTDVVNASKLWGFEPLNVTLDFDPSFILDGEMSADAFMAEINEILAIPIDLDTARKVVYNSNHLKNVKLFLEDVDA